MKNSKIAWTDHTFNPWWGCVRVSEGCVKCYAETFSKRTGNDIWGVDKPRRFFGDKHWDEPFQWDVEAQRSGKRTTVFCASMADVFEDRRDLDEPRERLWKLIGATPFLTWLLLTKRPANMADMLPISWRAQPLSNVWLGTTVEDQNVDFRISILKEIPAAIRWLSVEPMIGPVCIERMKGIDWVIVGGESGAGCRPMQLDWARHLRDDCKDNNVAFFMKQLGGHPNKRDQLEDFPEDLRIRELPK